MDVQLSVGEFISPDFCAPSKVIGLPEEVEFRRELSGLVTLNSEGNADLSTEIGALAMYLDKSGLLYAEEVFDGAKRLVFVSKPYHD